MLWPLLSYANAFGHGIEACCRRHTPALSMVQGAILMNVEMRRDHHWKMWTAWGLMLSDFPASLSCMCVRSLSKISKKEFKDQNSLSQKTSFKWQWTLVLWLPLVPDGATNAAALEWIIYALSNSSIFSTTHEASANAHWILLALACHMTAKE